MTEYDILVLEDSSDGINGFTTFHTLWPKGKPFDLDDIVNKLRDDGDVSDDYPYPEYCEYYKLYLGTGVMVCSL
jgi:hypothetical protein